MIFSYKMITWNQQKSVKTVGKYINEKYAQCGAYILSIKEKEIEQKYQKKKDKEIKSSFH